MNYYAVINGQTMKYCRWMDVIGKNDAQINPYEETSYVGHAFFCESVEEAEQRIEERYKGIIEEPRIVRFTYQRIEGDGRYRLQEWELLE